MDVWIPRPPPSWPAGVGAGVVAGASWPSTWRLWALGRGMLCPHPPCSLLHSSLWVSSPLSQDSLMPLTDCMQSWIPPGSSKSSSSGPSLSLYLQLSWDVFQTRKCLPLLFILSAPQLSKCCVAPSICLWEHWIEVWGEERPSQIYTPAFFLWTDHYVCLLSPWSSAQCLCPLERKGNMSWPWSRSFGGPCGSSPTSFDLLSPREVSSMFWVPFMSSALYLAPLGPQRGQKRHRKFTA